MDSRITLETLRAMAQGGLAVSESLVSRQGREGHYYSLYAPLLPLISLPGYRLGLCFESNPPLGEEQRIGWADWLGLTTNQWISALILVVLFAASPLFEVSVIRPWIVVTISAVTTMILPYSRDYFTQPLAALCLLSSFVCLLRFQSQKRSISLFLASLWAGMAVLTRMDMVFVFPGILLTGCLLIATQNGTRSRFLCALMGPWIVCVVILLLFDWYRWGGLLATPYRQLPFGTPLIDSLPRFLVSRDLSVFLFNPILLLSVYFMVRAWKRHWRCWAGILLCDVIYMVTVAKYVDYHGGICPGPRYLLALVPLNLLPLLAGFGKTVESERWIFYLLPFLVLTGLLINGYYTWVDYTQAPSVWDYWFP